MSKKTIPAQDKDGKLRLLASIDGAEDSITMNADAKLYAGTFDGAQYSTLAMDPSRKAYVHLIKGALTVNGQRLSGGDAAMIANESRIEISQGGRGRGTSL